MPLEGNTGKTKNDVSFVYLQEEGSENVVLKAYSSPDSSIIRIVLPELVDFTQTLIEPNRHMISFSRKPLNLAGRRS
jgi:hypothetical protein